MRFIGRSLLSNLVSLASFIGLTGERAQVTDAARDAYALKNLGDANTAVRVGSGGHRRGRNSTGVGISGAGLSRKCGRGKRVRGH